MAFIGKSLVIVIAILLCFTPFEHSVFAEDTDEEYLSSLSLENLNVHVEVRATGEGPCFVSLHANETTSIVASSSFDGTHVRLRHKGGRNVNFSYNGVHYTFDPNRIFTATGRAMHVRGSRKPENVVVESVATLAKQIVAGCGSARPFVGLHNNTDGSYSFAWYEKGGRLARDAIETYRAPGQDLDDFVLTTVPAIFARAKEAGYNAVLQSPEAPDDGSLSVFAAKSGIPYVNVEVETGKLTLQQKMLSVVLETNWRKES